MTGKPPMPVVLVVDDEPMIRMFAVDILTDAGFKVFEAGNAQEALAMLGEHAEITVLFTDINMPGPLDGLELAREVHRTRPDVQLIITSGKERPAKGQIPQNSSFVPKPYQPTALAALIQAASTA